MQEIIEKRSALLNYFFNQSVNYSKKDILAKEYAALSFSPREEYIDAFKTDYDDMLNTVEDLEEDLPEILIKGIIVDVDMKKNYCIIHLQNKGDNISASLGQNVLYRYGDYLQKGHLILLKGHTYQGKIYAHFLIDYNVNHVFIRENDYISKVSEMRVDNIDYDIRSDSVGLIRQVTYFKSRKGNNCVRLNIHEKGEEKTYITCNDFPRDLVAGMIVSYNISNNSAFINNLQEAKI